VIAVATFAELLDESLRQLQTKNLTDSESVGVGRKVPERAVSERLSTSGVMQSDFSKNQIGSD